jgi:hypothetical protein
MDATGLPARARGGTPLMRLNDLMWEVRSVTHAAEQAARTACARGEARYDTVLAATFDAWLGSWVSRDLLVCFCAALELGIHPGRHLDRCLETANARLTADERALFWAGMRRLRAHGLHAGGMPRRGLAPAGAGSGYRY